jgi:hypothetical protein
MMNAILKQLAPMAVMPPSPKTNAWITRATVIETTAAQGPRMMPTMAPPTAWPVLPPGMGRLNIMMTNENAADKASSGTCFDLKSFLNLYPA